jgi:phage tail-like protein
VNQADVLRFLPDVIRRTSEPGSPLDGIVAAMAHLLDPVDARMNQLDRYFDPFRTPTSMLPYLATWVGLGWLPVREHREGEGIAPERLRRLIALAPTIAQRRGTARSLEAMLSAALGLEDVEVADATSDPSIQKPFHIVVRLPVVAQADRRLIELIVRFEKPAHVTHELEFREHADGPRGPDAV